MKKVLSIILCLSLCIMYTLPVSAAEVIPKENVIEKEEISATSGSNCFSYTLPKLALMNGSATFSLGSISGNAQVTSVSVYVRVATGTSPVIIYIQAPDGTIYSFNTAASVTITTNQFNGCDPSGDWKIWIETDGIMTTSTITVKVCYDYIYD